jgi:type IV pilus assembly protein PilM
MPGPKVVWGIDVGQFALRGIKLRLLDSAAEVLAFDVVEYPQILSQPEVNADQLLAEAAEKFVSRNDLRGCDVVLGVPGQQTFTRFTKLPPVEPKKINSIVTYEAQQQIPFDIDEVIWDYQVFATPESPEVEVGIFASRRDLVRKYLSVFVDKGIEPVLVQASPLSLYNYLAFDDVPEEGAVVILDVGAQNTDLVVARKDGAWTRNIPLGGNNFTEALVKSFKLSFGKAEALKRTAASSRYARQIFQAMRPVFADLVAEIQRSLGYYNSTHRDVQMTKVIGMGNAFKLPGLQKYLQQNLQMEVDRISTFKKLQFATGVNPTVFNEYLMGMGVAYGLAIQGAGAGRIDNNLLPPEIARTMVWRRKTPWFGAAAAVLVIGGLAIGYSRARVASAVAKCSTEGFNTSVSGVPDAQAAIQTGVANAPTGRAKAEKILNAVQKLKGEFSSIISMPNGAEQLKNIAQLYKDRVFWIDLIERIHATLPQPIPDLAAAKTSADYVAGLKKIPRNQRKAIYIDEMLTGYVSDTGAAFASGSTSAGEMRGGGGSGDMRPGGGGDMRSSAGDMGGPTEVTGGPKGFIVILKGRTPYGESHPAAVVFVNEWARALKDMQGQSVPFYVDRIDATKVFPVTHAAGGSAGLLASTWAPADALSAGGGRTSLLANVPSPAAGGDMRPGGGDPNMRPGGGDPNMRPGGGGDMRPGGGGDMGGGGMNYGNTGAAPPTALDPLTGEPAMGDYVFQVKFTVIPGQAPKAGEAAPAAPAAPPPQRADYDYRGSPGGDRR